MNNAVQGIDQTKGGMIEQVLIKGDLTSLTAEQRSNYYMKVCDSVGLNMLTKPFEYILLNGKLTLYALRSCTDQLRSIYKVSVEELAETEREGVFIVTAKVRNGEGRTDIAKGAVNISGLKGEPLANALMKAETKAKRRATLSICGLGMLDETEIETIPGASIAPNEPVNKPSIFKNASLRNTFCSNVIAAFDAAKTVVELNEMVTLNLPKLQDMKASGNEHDELAAEEIHKRYRMALMKFKQPMPQEEDPTFDPEELPPFLKDEFKDGGRTGIDY